MTRLRTWGPHLRVQGLAATWDQPFMPNVRTGAPNVASLPLVFQPPCFRVACWKAPGAPLKWDHRARIGTVTEARESPDGLTFKAEVWPGALGRAACGELDTDDLGVSVGASGINVHGDSAGHLRVYKVESIAELSILRDPGCPGTWFKVTA